MFGGVKPGVTKEEGLRVLESGAHARAGGHRVALDYAGESRQIRREGSALTGLWASRSSSSTWCSRRSSGASATR